ncbi:ketoacyl-synt-domain-containing protein [Apiospora arundinis]|uniref:Ketoacyl-synt-domain-containing protein n=1 Tax=Apiospora arundinis TaxID=335852 RepID=A0ABR2IAG0_9PEZI
MAPSAVNGHDTSGQANGHTNGLNNGVGTNGMNGRANGMNGTANGHENGLNGDSSINGGHRRVGDAFPGETHATSNCVAPETTKPKTKPMPLAIVGMSCRLPGNVASAAEFWELCARARSGYSTIPKSRFDTSSFQHPNPGKAGCHNPVGGHFLSDESVDLAAFDAPFFSLTEKEAISMDPQQRLLLECTFEALENAGVPKHTIVGKDVGVFVGGSFPEYESHCFRDTDRIPMHQATGCAYAMQSNRLSHFFDLKGPSFTTDTACSSSLVALHLACQSLRAGESSMAIVGGCHLNMLPEFWISFAKSRLFSDSGRSYSFDSRGTGFGRGEGCGMIILKPLDQARRDNDSIRAVIVGSGINQDGKTPGITMPCGTAQETLMRQVYQNAGIKPSDTGFIEAHGTGTRVGDPIEATAIHNVFGANRSARDPLLLGSVKSNIGHLEGASGIVAVIKAAIMLERGFVLPNYDFAHPNEKIPFKDWHMKVPVNQRPWPRNKKYVSVNNFGFGGTNAHVVLERLPFTQRGGPKNDADLKDEDPGRMLFAMSANDKASLESVMKQLVIYLEQRPEMFQKDLMSNVAYTLCQRRSLLQWRVAIPAKRSFDLIDAINSQKFVAGKENDPLRIGFIFTGQGAQWYGMGRELYEHYPVFTKAIDYADQCLASLGAPWSLVEELSKDEKTTAVGAAHISQPSCTAIQLALTDLLFSWGVRPTAVAGHSSGEIGAAYAASILTFEACVAIAYHRGRLIPVLKERHPELRGAMMAVGGTKEEFEPLLSDIKGGNVRIACYNSPSSLTISGDEAGIDELKAIVEEKQLFNRKLFVDTAYHSHHMSLIGKDYLQSIRMVDSPVPTETRFHSSLVGRQIDGTELEPSYWVQNLTCPVKFSEAVHSMVEPVGEHRTGVNMLVELGPHSALQGPLKQILKATGGPAAKIPYASMLGRKKDAVETAMEVASTLFTKGAVLDFEAINYPKPTKTPMLLTDLPRYPWNKSSKYWHESRLTLKHKNRSTPRNDILGTEAKFSSDLEPTWRNIVRLDDLPWLEHHKIQSLTIFPMSGYIAMAVEAVKQMAMETGQNFDHYQLENVVVTAPLVISDEDMELTTTLRPHQERTAVVASETWREFRINSWTSSQGWKEHCKGFVAVVDRDTNEVDGDKRAKETSTLREASIKAVNQGASKAVDSARMYEQLAELGVSYGSVFQGITNGSASDKCCKSDLIVPDVAKEMPSHHISSAVVQPAFLESLISMYWLVVEQARGNLDVVYLPSSVERISISKEITEATSVIGNKLQAFCEASKAGHGTQPMTLTMFTASPTSPLESLITLDGLTVTPILDREAEAAVSHRELCYKLDWEPMVNESDTPAEPKLPEADIVIVHADTPLQKELAVSLADVVHRGTGRRPVIGSLFSVNTGDKLCIFLAELERPLLSTLRGDQFAALQKILTSVQGVLWVVRGAYDHATSPDMNMVTGLSRTIRSETLLPFATLDLDGQVALSVQQILPTIIKTLSSAFGPTKLSTGELEFMERNGQLLTPRIINDPEMNEIVHDETNLSALRTASFDQTDRPLKLAIGDPGILETLHFTDDDTLATPLESGIIEIEVKAIGVNHRDLAAAHGKLANTDFGFEASGIITAAGSDVRGLQIGDRVATLSVEGGAFATKLRAKSSFAFKLPAEMGFEAGASLPLAYSTAYYSLIELGRLHEDETVLIHAAAGAVGQAAVSLAQMVGADVYATVGSPEKKHVLVSEYGIPEDHIFYSRNLAFGNSLRTATTGRGVDVVLNCVGGDALKESWQCLNKFGRLIDIGTRDTDTSTRLEMVQFEHNASFTSVDMISLAAERPKIMQRLLSNVSKLVKYNKVRPVLPITTYPISEIEGALKTLQSTKSHGKLVVVPSPGDNVKATSPKTPRQILRSDATYLLIGGTGGLGRSMSRWMVSRGARHLVLLSRSGSATGKVKELIDEVNHVGAEIVVQKCDVANPADVENLVTYELEDMPPVRGVVHGAMVLRDVLFEKMTYEQYTTVIESKVQGAWNFHHALRNVPLDFFVAISSAAGAVGNRGQAAYAAANCFLNAFVQYRLSQGLPASSMDLTAISDTGYLAEDAEKAAEVAKNLGGDTICEAEVLALLSTAIDGRMAASCNNHAITGMRITPTMQPFWTTDAKFKHLREAAEAAAAADASLGASSKVVSYNAAVKSAQSVAEAEQVVCDGLVYKLAAVMMMEEEDLDVTRSLSYYPLDSLVAIEIRNFITREFEATLQVLELLSSGSIQTLAKAVCVKSKLVNFAG